MSVSTDPGHFFQTEAALNAEELRRAKASNKNGFPIQVGSKILDLQPDPLNDDQIYVAESSGLARRITLSSNTKGSHVFRSHTGPCSCLVLAPSGNILFTGSWDKSIIMWNTETRESLQTFLGHGDFVKSVAYIPSLPTGLLLSGSSDSTIIIWEEISGSRFQTLQGHRRAVTDIAIDPLSDPTTAYDVYTAGSEPDIHHWRICPGGALATEVEGGTISEHETSVYRVRFTGEDLDMWTASADCTAKRIDRVTGKADTTLTHPDFVNDVLVDHSGRWVITACRDEQIRVWDATSGAIVHTFEGHFNEVTKLALVGVNVLVSGSIDGTVRRWSLNPKDMAIHLGQKKPPLMTMTTEEIDRKDQPISITEEEERELLELMEDGDS